MAKASSTINFTPPKAVREACKRGLALKDEFGGKGLREPTVQKARDFVAGKPNDPAHARKMRAWFKRHDVDKRPGWEKPPTPGYVARLLWGGDAGQKWVEQLVSRLEAQEAEADGAAGGSTKRGKKVGSRKVGQKTASSKAGAKKASKKVGKKAATKKVVKKTKAAAKKSTAQGASRAAKTHHQKGRAGKR
jgi:hypothetical protein